MSDARFSIECPECGEVELGAEQLWLVVPTLGDAHYDFYCPSCAALVTHIAGDDAVAFLAPLVAVEEVDVPAEALEPKVGPTLTVDDLLDFSLSLGRDDWADELLRDATGSR